MEDCPASVGELARYVVWYEVPWAEVCLRLDSFSRPHSPHAFFREVVRGFVDGVAGVALCPLRGEGGAQCQGRVLEGVDFSYAGPVVLQNRRRRSWWWPRAGDAGYGSGGVNDVCVVLDLAVVVGWEFCADVDEHAECGGVSREFS